MFSSINNKIIFMKVGTEGHVVQYSTLDSSADWF